MIITLYTSIDVSTPILNVPLYEPPYMVMEVTVRILANEESNSGLIDIVYEDGVEGFKESKISLVYVPASI